MDSNRDGRVRVGRLQALDVLRGLIMILMALDHASYFVAGVHRSELWSRPLPVYTGVLPFLTRLVSHFCAPGFFLLMGAGMALFASARGRDGWTGRRISLHLALRGLILIGLQFLAENPAWSIHDEGGLRITPYFGVLYSLGGTMLVWSMLLRLPTWLVTAVSLACVAGTQVLVPVLAPGGAVDSPWLGFLLTPGASGGDYVLYPVVPWLGVAGLGVCLGRMLIRDAAGACRLLLIGGGVALALFLVARLTGVGDFHGAAGAGWMSLFGVTKYPPSWDFLLLTLGADSLVLWWLLRLGERPAQRTAALAGELRGDRAGEQAGTLGDECSEGRSGFQASACGDGGMGARSGNRPVGRSGERPGGWVSAPVRVLAVYGRTPLFFYVIHLYLYALIGLALPHPTSLAGMYPIWILGLAALYPACRAYGRFKASRTTASVWRMF